MAGNDPRVAGLVYIAAFAPDNGESVGKLIANPAPGAPVPPILPPVEGFLLLDRAKFAASFAADVQASRAEFMAESQVPWGLDALNGEVTQAAWKTKPSWYLVTTDDHMIPPDAQRFMSKRARAIAGGDEGESCAVRVASRAGREADRTGSGGAERDSRQVEPRRDAGEVAPLCRGPRAACSAGALRFATPPHPRARLWRGSAVH